jgi:UDPglucose 6-dehydrogenase
MEEAKSRLADMAEAVTYCADEYEAIHGAGSLVILTEWNQFRNLDLDRIKAELEDGFFFDLRNIYKRELVENSGLVYIGVGI